MLDEAVVSQNALVVYFKSKWSQITQSEFSRWTKHIRNHPLWNIWVVMLNLWDSSVEWLCWTSLIPLPVIAILLPVQGPELKGSQFWFVFLNPATQTCKHMHGFNSNNKARIYTYVSLSAFPKLYDFLVNLWRISDLYFENDKKHPERFIIIVHTVP